MKQNRLLFFFITLLLLPLYVVAQAPTVKIGKTEVALNEPFTITVTTTNENLRTYSNFPDIPNFRKAGTSSSTSTNIVNGNITFTQSITQNYFPQKEGKYTLPPFTMKINDQIVKSNGATITVTAPKQRQQPQGYDPFADVYDPFADFFGRSAPKEFIDVQEDAFFALSTPKDEVYMGEGFNVSLALYVAESNRAQMQFYEIGQQLTDILKKIRPANCWEENFNIDEIQPRAMEINGKNYTQYKIYEANFYPLNTEPIKFPSVPLKMIKYKVAKRPSFFGQNHQEDFKTFYTKPKIVKVKELPPHPLRDKVSVGNFRLEEEISTNSAKTGESVNYYFKVKGEGNIAYVKEPMLTANSRNEFEIYPPSIRQNIDRSNGRVFGDKIFNYFLIPQEAGSYPLADYFQWIYFNPAKEKYDTLRSQITLDVQGESQKNIAIRSQNKDNFYSVMLERSSDNFSIKQVQNMLQFIANTILLIIVFVAGYFIVRK